MALVENIEMDEPTIGREAAHIPEDVLKVAVPFQTAWRKAFFDLPLAVFSESIRFAGQRLQAQGDFFASLKSCHSLPEVIEVQSSFVRATVDEYGAETSKIMEDVRMTMSKAA